MMHSPDRRHDPRYLQQFGDFPVSKILGALGVSAAAVALSLFALSAEAQQKAPEKSAPSVAAKKPPPPPKCNSLKDEAACKARDDCTWVSAVMDKAGKKEVRKAYCRAKPKAPAKKAEPAKK
jgi:hypothetical protein